MVHIPWRAAAGCGQCHFVSVRSFSIGNESMLKIIKKITPYILFEKYIYILALEMASPVYLPALCQLYRHTFVPYDHRLVTCLYVDMFMFARASNAADPSSVINARRMETSFISKWIKDY